VTQTDAGPAPTRNDIWLLFQTLIGMWPAQPPSDAERDDLRHRVQAYMLKAVREAKSDTSWTSPVPAYEDAVEKFVDAVMRSGQPNPFVDELDRLTAKLAPFGFRNSLAQLALKFTVPGVPDLYQGSEQWAFSLVDPDNRRPVDFGKLAAQLESMRRTKPQWGELWADAADGRIKLLVTWRLLQLRNAFPKLFECGSYAPLALRGPASDHAVAFARHHESEVVVVVAARLTYTLCGGDDARWSRASWSETLLDLDSDAIARVPRWRNWFTGEEFTVARTGEAVAPLSDVFSGVLPFAVFVPAA
jgi:(1->4)-alpha-D-glucan 1-alpha-D-glucosylmutase